MNPSLDTVLDHYREQVLRWNKQINLVSRQETVDRLERLILQCRQSWIRLREEALGDLAPDSRLWYFDLGSGGGLPGLVWHLQAAAEEISLRTLLVEPREKRAWFLDRLNSLEGVAPFGVRAARWENAFAGDRWGGAGADPELDQPTHILVSLKALHLADVEVLEGLVPFLAGDSLTEGAPKILIARFYPPDQAWSSDLARDLDIPTEGEGRAFPGWEFRAAGGTLLSPRDPRGASLVLSPYLARPS